MRNLIPVFHFCLRAGCAAIRRLAEIPADGEGCRCTHACTGMHARRVSPLVLLKPLTPLSLSRAQVQVLNHDRTKLVADKPLSAGPSITREGSISADDGPSTAPPGALVRMLRGTYTVRVPQHEDEEYFPETATLNLTRVPLPKSAYLGPIELIVPMRAKPKIAVVLLGQFDLGG